MKNFLCQQIFAAFLHICLWHHFPLEFAIDQYTLIFTRLPGETPMEPLLRAIDAFCDVLADSLVAIRLPTKNGLEVHVLF